MKPVISIAAAAALGFAACDQSPSSGNDTTPVTQAKAIPGQPDNLVADARTLQIGLAPYEQPAQHIKVTLDKPKDITGAKGTVIHLDPADLETEDGSTAGKNAELTLIELTDKNEMMRSNVQTASNGKLLVSGGAYYIDCSANGHRLRLKQGRTLCVSFPKKARETMNLFYGSRDSSGNMNWLPVNVTLKPQHQKDSVEERIAVITLRDSFTREGYNGNGSSIRISADSVKQAITTKRRGCYNFGQIQQVADTQYMVRKTDAGTALHDQLYARAQITQMGWINCDRFYDIQQTTELLVNTEAAYKGKFIRMYILFKKMNSVLSQQFYPSGNHYTVSGLPANEPVRIVAFSVAGGLHAYCQDVVLNHTTLQLTLKPASEAYIRKLMQLPAAG